jgi:hypothetical protein
MEDIRIPIKGVLFFPVLNELCVDQNLPCVCQHACGGAHSKRYRLGGGNMRAAVRHVATGSDPIAPGDAYSGSRRGCLVCCYPHHCLFESA